MKPVCALLVVLLAACATTIPVPPARVRPIGPAAIAATSTPIAIPVAQLHGTEILIPIDFRHGKQRMNVRVHTDEGYPWGVAPFDQTISLKVWRDRAGVRSLVQTVSVSPCFPCSTPFAVSDAFQYGDILAIEWRPGVCTRPGCTVVSIIDNKSNDPVTRPEYVRDGEVVRQP